MVDERFFVCFFFETIKIRTAQNNREMRKKHDQTKKKSIENISCGIGQLYAYMIVNRETIFRYFDDLI